MSSPANYLTTSLTSARAELAAAEAKLEQIQELVDTDKARTVEAEMLGAAFAQVAGKKKRVRKEKEYDSSGKEIKSALLPYAYFMKMNCTKEKSLSATAVEWKKLGEDAKKDWVERCDRFNVEEGRRVKPKKAIAGGVKRVVEMAMPQGSDSDSRSTSDSDSD